jgi:hypothetical protein
MAVAALYEAFLWVFWPVMAWGTLSAWVQRREDLWRAVWLNMVGQFVGYAIIWINATFGFAIDKPYYYMVQFAIFAIVMTNVRAGMFGALCSGISLAGFIIAVIFKISLSSDDETLFYYALGVSSALVLVIAGAASGDTGKRVARACWRCCGGADLAPDNPGSAR